MDKLYKFPAIRFRQTEVSNWIAYFSANVIDLDKMSGIPQKRNFDNAESIGFQRTVKEERLANLVNFYTDEKNVVQNPLVCATRNPGGSSELSSCVTFVPRDEYLGNESVQVGTIQVTYDDFSKLSLFDCLTELKAQLKDRVNELEDLELDQTLLAKLKEKFFSEDYASLDEDVDQVESSNEEVSFDNSHIKDFWQEVVCRLEILKEVPSNQSVDEVLGFTKEAVCSYLKPIVIVDGQHRLSGAIECARKLADETYFSEVTALMEQGSEPEDAVRKIQQKYARDLPVSLLMSDDPEEHVFQFVVVNQKATPINKALLGTIVSTTLSDEELTKVTSRLKNADIPLEDSKAISMVTRRSDSPFRNLVQTGIEKEQGGKIQWSVMKGLISMFRDLKGGKYFSDEDSNDHIYNWQTELLPESKIVLESVQTDGQPLMDVWREEDIWYDVFKCFWTKVRDHFGNLDDRMENNYWGNTRSNLFNKISLTILAVDFFSFMNDRQYAIDSLDDLGANIDKWLDGTSQSYFVNDWNLEVKKDTPAQRKKWNRLWVNYRKTPKSRKKLPAKTEFSKF